MRISRTQQLHSARDAMQASLASPVVTTTTHTRIYLSVLSEIFGDRFAHAYVVRTLNADIVELLSERFKRMPLVHRRYRAAAFKYVYIFLALYRSVAVQWMDVSYVGGCRSMRAHTPKWMGDGRSLSFCDHYSRISIKNLHQRTSYPEQQSTETVRCDSRLNRETQHFYSFFHL